MADLLPFNDLLNFHRNQETLEMGMLGLVFSVSLSLIGFIGARKEGLPRTVRVIMALVYGLFVAMMLASARDSMQVHDAIHRELRIAAVMEPGRFYQEHVLPTQAAARVAEGSYSLQWVFREKYGKLPWRCLLGGGALIGALVVAFILGYGPGRLYRLPVLRGWNMQ